jgi:signal transduction histidine kinase
VIVDDIARDTRFAVPALLREHDVLSDITVVIATRGEPFGTLAAMSAKRRSFSEDDVDFMQSVANVLAAAVERAEADRRLDGAREAERSRIARDLHDEALRELTDVLAVAAMSRPASAQRQDDQRWAALITSLRRVGQQLRSAIYDLTFSADEGHAFADLIAEMVAIQAEAAGDRRLELHGAEALPTRPLGHRGNEALRIVREAITNARRHSGATTIRVDAGGSSEEVLRVEVSDDGGWPDRAATLSSGPGTGIASMLERADLLGAELQIEDRPGGGTRVCLELTLFADEQGG